MGAIFLRPPRDSPFHSGIADLRYHLGAVRWSVLLVVLAACGRFGFGDDQGPPDAGSAGPVPFAPEAFPGPPDMHLFAVWGTSATNVYAVGFPSTPLHRRGDGTWVAESYAEATSFYGIGGSGPSDVFAVGNVTTM